jgi:hypothetical protein
MVNVYRADAPEKSADAELRMSVYRLGIGSRRER